MVVYGRETDVDSAENAAVVVMLAELDINEPAKWLPVRQEP